MYTVIILSFTVVWPCVLSFSPSSHPSGPWSVLTSDEWHDYRWIPFHFFLTPENHILWMDRSGSRVPNILLTRISVIVLYLSALVDIFAGKIETLTAVLFVIQYDATCRNVLITIFSYWKNDSIKTKTNNIIVYYVFVGDSDLGMNGKFWYRYLIIQSRPK